MTGTTGTNSSTDERLQLAHRLTERSYLIPDEEYRRDVEKAAALLQPSGSPTALMRYADTINHRYQPPNEIEVPGTCVMVSVGDAHVIWAGEYPEDCPDLLIRVEHAVDEDGRDIRDVVARRIVDAILLSGALWVAAFRSEADVMAQGVDPLAVTR